MTDGDAIGEFAFWLAMGLIGISVFFGPVGRALGRWLEPRRAPPHADSERLGEIEHRLVELEQSQSRVAELEERLDFAERMLAQQRDPARLGDGGA